MDLVGELLKASLLESLGDDTERADKLRAASATLAERLTGPDRAVVPHAVLAASGPGDDDWSVLDLAHEILVGEWETLPNAYPDRPRELLRAVLLAGVAGAAETDAQVRVAAWYTLRTALEQGAGDRWTETLSNLLRRWDADVREQVSVLWQPAPASYTVRMPSLNEPESFTMNTRDSIIASATEVQAAGNYQLVSNQLQQTYVDTVTKLIELAEGAGAAGARRAVAEVKNAFTELGQKLRQALELHERGLEAVRLRGELLWWLQSRYSPSLELGYAELDDAAEIAITSALDLHRLVPALAPVAAEHVLMGLVRAVAPTDQLSVSELRDAAATERLPGSSTGTSPATLLTAVSSSEAASVAPALNADAGVATERAAVILFRDLQAAAAAETASG